MNFDFLGLKKKQDKKIAKEYVFQLKNNLEHDHFSPKEAIEVIIPMMKKMSSEDPDAAKHFLEVLIESYPNDSIMKTQLQKMLKKDSTGNISSLT